MGTSRALVEEASRLVKEVRVDPYAEWPAGTLEQVDLWLDIVLEGMPPDSGPDPISQFFFPLLDGAEYGQTKWLAGSLGCDLFVPRGTPVYAPDDVRVVYVRDGVGASGGAEIIIAKPDNSWAWRYRHVQATVRLGEQVSWGHQVAKVMDASMDWLGRVPSWFQAPDNYQHLDLSVNQGTDQFSPQGGGGGNTNAYQWLQSIGYQGRVWGRTPGPSEGSGRMTVAQLVATSR